MHHKPAFAYIAFDLFPSQKGAATHIEHCLNALKSRFCCGILICLGNDDMPAVQFDAERLLFVYRFKEKIANYLHRTQAFQYYVEQILLIPTNAKINLCHFRDLWGATAVFSSSKKYKTVFEINSFASIELPVRFPFINRETLQKIQTLQFENIKRCDAIITPSTVTKNYIIKSFPISKEKITVIPNGVHIFKPVDSTNSLGEYFLYFGALQNWQGIKTLLKSLREISDLEVKLVICSSVPENKAKIYKDLALDYGVSHQIIWFYELDKLQLAQIISSAIFTIAPLSACDRNLVQGCNPLKILESMAYGIPVVATHLPVVTEIIINNKTGFLVAPDRPELLGRKVRSLLSERKNLLEIGKNAEKHIKENYLWEYQEAKMQHLYNNLING